MISIKNNLALLAYDLVALSRGYRFTVARSQTALDDAATIYHEDGFSFPEHLQEQVEKYKKGVVTFVAYHRGEPVGVVRIANPHIINRPYELYGVDSEGRCCEIQSLTVKKEHRDASQFVMIGLVRKLYAYSLANGVTTWSACGANHIYLTMRRYCKITKAVDINFSSIGNDLTRYLYAHKIIETYFTMDLAGFSPWGIFVQCMKKMIKRRRSQHKPFVWPLNTERRATA